MTHESTPEPKNRKRKAKPHQRLVSSTQAPEEYGPPYRTFYDAYCRGELAGVRFGRRLWFERRDIEAWIAMAREVRS